MAFCNSCGANLTPGTRFCNKCGAAVLASTLPPVSAAPSSASTPAPTVAPTPPAQTGGGGALKVILIVLGVLVLLAVMVVSVLGFVAWRVAKHARVHHDDGNVKVDLPFGSVNSDPEEAARNLGVDIYPGAQAQKQGASSVTVMGMRTATVRFGSNDPISQVSAFYKSRFPNATVSSCDQYRCAIVSNDQRGTVTINIEAEGSGTRFQITSVSKKPN